MVKIFASAVGVYPLGSLVALESGEVGVVVDGTDGRVKLVRDAEGSWEDFARAAARSSEGRRVEVGPAPPLGRRQRER